MTKKEARAILRFQLQVQKAIDQLRPKLDKELPSAEAYWLGRIQATIWNEGYGSMPVHRAADLIQGE